MDSMYIKPPDAKLFYAELIYERLQNQLESISRKVNDGEAVVLEVLLPNGNVFRPNDIGYHNPGLIVFYANDEDGRQSKLLVSHTNINVLMSIVKKDEEIKRQIGFIGSVEKL